MASSAVVFGLGLAAGLVLLFVVVQIVSRDHLLAVPDHRSSHTRPTPTMGGIAIVVVVLAYLVLLAESDPRLGWMLFATLAALALVGLWDDLAPLSALLRLVVHFVAAGAALWLLWPDAPAGTSGPDLPALAHFFGIMPWHIDGPAHLSFREVEAFVEAARLIQEPPDG